MPRNEPWRPVSPPLPEQPGRTPVPARDAQGAYIQWLKDTGQYDQSYDMSQRASAKRAFLAGWAARDKINCDPAKLDEGSLFPTMGLSHDV